MKSLEMPPISVSVSCAHCRATNTLVADVGDYARVHCSSCRQPLGSWGELRRDLTPDQRPMAAAE